MQNLSYRAAKRLVTTMGLFAVAWAVLPVAAQAQAYPSRQIKFVVPFPAGSATDVVGRVVGQAMSEALGQPIAIENKPGANGILGAEQVKGAAADGYTLLVTTSTTQAANASLYKKLSYDTVKDFTPIGKVGITGFILLGNQSVPPNDLPSLIAHLKQNPGKLSYGHGSSGSLVSASMFGAMAGIDWVSVPYKGIPPAITDVLGGSLQFVFADVGNALAQMKGGKVKAYGITTAKRSPQAQTVPAISEALPGYELVAWFGLVGPANLPVEVTAKLSAALQAAMRRDDVKQKLLAGGIDSDPLAAEGFGKLIASETLRWADLVKQAKIQPE